MSLGDSPSLSSSLQGELLRRAAPLAAAARGGALGLDNNRANTGKASDLDNSHESWEVERDKLAERLSLVLAMCVLRFRPYMDSWTVLWLVAYCSGVAVQAALRRHRRSLYLRLRPYTAAAFRAAGLGLGCATLLKQRMLEDALHAVPSANTQDDNALVSVLRIVFTSGGATMLLMAFGWQTWLSLSIAAQLVLVATAAVYTPHLCSALVAAHPSAQQELHWMHQLLSGVSLLVPLPVAPLRAPPPPATVPAAECQALLTYMQLCGCLLPLACQALREARLLIKEQQRRQAAGLPPKQGPLAACQQWLWRASGEGSSARLALACFVMVAVAWNCVQLFEY